MDFFSLTQKWRQNKSKNEQQQQHSFDHVREAEKAFESVKRDQTAIPLEKIIGSVGRYSDFDKQFRLQGAGTDDRLQSFTQALQDGRPIPPVSLYQIKDGYYIVDGHHRVTAARNLRQSHIQANILELLPSEDNEENRLYLEKIDFRDKVAIPQSLELTEPGQTEYLLQQILKHQKFLAKDKQKDISLKTAGTDWYRTIYLPLKTIIKNSDLHRSFPERTIDDLYLYISSHQWQKESKRRYGIGIDKLIPRDMEEFRRKMAKQNENTYPEMKRNITIFVLLNVDGTQEQALIDNIFALPEVDELHSVHGSIDLIVKATLSRDLLASDAEVISHFTHSSLRRMRGVVSTQTLIPGVSMVKPHICRY